MNIYEKLLEIQKEVGAIKKNSENPFFHSSYFDINKLLEVLKPVLTKHKLVLLQPIVVRDGRNVLGTTLINVEDTKEVILSEAVLPENPDPQKMGSAITYFRRYALQSLLALEAEDDDGESAKPVKKAVKISTPNKQRDNFNVETDLQALSELAEQ